MPVRQLKPADASPEEIALLEQLTNEWRQPTNNSQPVILLEQQGPHRAEHIYVVWDAWAGVERIRRSELIMDAFEAIHGLDKALDVTIAMGLTATEADRLGINWH